MPEKGDGRKFHVSLRNSNINYRNGWFFVTVQVAHNKSLFGSIVGEKCVLNDFGMAVADYWAALGAKYPELEVFESVLMPNHFHALIRIHFRPTNHAHHLGFLMSRFKGGTGFIYGRFRRAGLVEDIGEHLWQRDYWDDLVTSEAEFAAIGNYIRKNPANWSRDRYGICTSYLLGDAELLNGPRIAFVASQGFHASDLKPRKILERAAKAARTDRDMRGPNQAARTDRDMLGPNQAARADTSLSLSGSAASAADSVLISTFTSAQEREALRRALAKGRRVVQVVPQGIPLESELPPMLLAALREGRALLVSPQPPLSRLNKKVATWCNEYVLRHADAIWVGDLSPNGMLKTMLKSLLDR